MTNPRSHADIDQLLERWMERAAPEEAPTRLLEETFVRTMNARQAGTPWRSFDLHPLARLAVSAAAVVIAVTLAAYLLAPGGRIGGPVVPTASPSPVMSPSPSLTAF